MVAQQEIRSLLNTFQDGYTRRDISQLEEFLDLFTLDIEVIGTNGVKPGMDEWYTNRETARELVKGDWESWGDLVIDLETASIKVNGNVGWVAVTCTVSQTIGSENYASYLEFTKEFIEKSTLTPEKKLQYILRGGTNTIYELSRGEKFVWPLRLTAVVVQESGSWKFAQINFSFPTVYFPDVRVLDQD